MLIGGLLICIGFTAWGFAIWLLIEPLPIEPMQEYHGEQIKSVITIGDYKIIMVCAAFFNGFIAFACGISTLLMPFGINYHLAKQVLKSMDHASNK